MKNKLNNSATEMTELEELRSRPKLKKNEFYGDIPILMQLEAAAEAEDRLLDEKTKSIYKLIRENML